MNKEDKRIDRIAERFAEATARALDKQDAQARNEVADYARSQVSETDRLRRELKEEMDKHYATKAYVLATLNTKVYVLMGFGVTVLATLISGLFRVLFP